MNWTTADLLSIGLLGTMDWKTQSFNEEYTALQLKQEAPVIFIPSVDTIKNKDIYGCVPSPPLCMKYHAL